MTIVLGPEDGLTSTSMIQADIGSSQLLVISGIALPEWKINDDKSIQHNDVLIRLGAFALQILQSTVTVGLCSIHNDGSAFTFAVDDAKVSLDPNSGELTLETSDALLGSTTVLSRFSYQVVALVTSVKPSIVGAISWDGELWNPPATSGGSINNPSAVDPQLSIVASQIIPPSGGSKFGSTVPAATGHVTLVEKVHSGTTVSVIAHYEILGLPIARELTVTVQPGPAFRANARGRQVTAEPVGGPAGAISLKTQRPTMSRDFGISVVEEER